MFYSSRSPPGRSHELKFFPKALSCAGLGLRQWEIKLNSSHSFQCGCPQLFTCWGTAYFLTGFKSSHSDILFHILLSQCLCRGTGVGSSYSATLLLFSLISALVLFSFPTYGSLVLFYHSFSCLLWWMDTEVIHFRPFFFLM